VVGNLLSVRNNYPRKLAEWSQIYGRTVGVRMGNRQIVALHDPEHAKAVLSDSNTTGRDQDFIFGSYFQGKGEHGCWVKASKFFVLTDDKLSKLRKMFLSNSHKIQQRFLADRILKICLVFYSQRKSRVMSERKNDKLTILFHQTQKTHRCFFPGKSISWHTKSLQQLK
jgi:hypothetical protein